MKNSSKNLFKRKLVIGFVLDDRLDKPDGVQQYVTTLGSWLTRQGHDVHYLVGESPSLLNRPDVHHLGKTVEVRFNKNRVGIPLPAKKSAVKKILNEFQFDVLHVQVPYSPQLAAKVVLAAKPETAIFGTFHILPYAKKEQVGTRLLAAVLQKSRRRFDHMFSVSPDAAVFAEKYFKSRSTVLPNVVDVAKFRTDMKRSGNKKRIVFLGRLVPRKGAAELLRAYEVLLEKHPHFAVDSELFIGGKGAQLATLREHASRIKQRFPTSTIEFTGFVAEEDKPRFLAKADIAVFPATGGESFGIVLLEGMAAGSHVVLAGENPGYRSVLGSIPGSMVEPTDAVSFSNSIFNVLSDSELSDTLHKQQQAYVQQFDVNVVGNELVRQYRAIALKKQTTHNSSNG